MLQDSPTEFRSRRLYTEAQISLPAEELGNIFGEFDKNIKLIEKELHVTIISREDKIKIIGEEGPVNKTVFILQELSKQSQNGDVIDEQNVSYLLSLKKDSDKKAIEKLDSDIICHTVTGKPVKPKTLGQKEYVDSIRKNMITFGIGPAGTGKTYLAMTMAVSAFARGDVSRIILTRPAIEAGEKLGFLPGDLQSKIDPYLRPLYDALYEIMGQENFFRNSEKGLIEVAPLAYMRGRTLDGAFIILDEAQNTTPSQMKMFLTRIGFGSKIIVTGDLTQKDLPADTVSGLELARRVISDIDGISFINLTGADVVRHPLVQKIVNAYEEYESKARGRKRK